MQQHRPLGDAGGATGVLQHRHIVRANHRLGKRRLGAARQRLVETHRCRQAEGRHDFFDIAHHVVHQCALDRSQLIAHGTQHHMLDGCGGQAFLQRAGKVLDDDDGPGATVLELVLQLARGVERIHVHQH